MDEISYWIYTKRAPCLYSFDSGANKNGIDVYYPKAKSVNSIADNPPPHENKKRKLSLLDDESSPKSERQQNLYFELSQIKVPRDKSEYKSDTVGSDIDFNVKKTSVRDKRKGTKFLKTTRTTLHKKNKLVTSTPKTTTLRRSLRKAQNCLNNNSQLNSSFEVLNCNVSYNVQSHFENAIANKSKPIQIHTSTDQTVPNKHHNDRITKPTIVANDQYEDLSDVSGFTANYIRSTKIHSTKRQRKLKSKSTNRNLMRESHHSGPRDESRMIVCVNKAVNTGIPQMPTLNCSTDSSQNVLNSVTVKNNNRSRKADKSTSELKFIEPNVNNNLNTSSDALDMSKNTVNNSDILFPTRTSRYPKRYKNNLTNSFMMISDKMNSSNVTIHNRRKKINKKTIHYNNSDRKENPEEKVVSRTRSGRNIGLTVRQPENSVLVLSNSAEVSSRASINVASPQVVEQPCDNRKRRKRVSARQLELKRSMDNCQSSRRESLRDRSGFAACFSDSDDSEPLKQKKFFC